MLFSEFIRNKVFGLLNTLGLKNTNQYILQLQTFEKNGKPFDLVSRSLNRLLKSAQQDVPFYAAYINNFDLSAYPVLNKKDLKRHYDLHKAAAQLYPKQVKVNTSGSYGTPVDYFLNPEKKSRQTAEVLFYGAKTGYFVGRKHGFFMSEPRKSNFKYWLQNEVFFSSKVLDDQFFKTSRARLKKGDISVLIGFPSAISLLAQYCLDQGDKPTDFNVQGVITCSENLDAQKRQVIAKAFNAPVHNRYSTEELGVIAYQQSEEGGFEINNMHYIVEVLALHEDKPVSVGETGRIVVTDLFNFAMPLIRYETGDLAVLKEVYAEQPNWAKSFSKFSGRTIQILTNTQGNKLYPLYLDSIMENFEHFDQYQFVQHTQTTYELRLVLNSKFKMTAELEVSMNQYFKAWLGQDAVLNFNVVDDIEMLPSGKRPYVINKLLS